MSLWATVAMSLASSVTEGCLCFIFTTPAPNHSEGPCIKSPEKGTWVIAKHRNHWWIWIQNSSIGHQPMSEQSILRHFTHYRHTGKHQKQNSVCCTRDTHGACAISALKAIFQRHVLVSHEQLDHLNPFERCGGGRERKTVEQMGGKRKKKR